MQIVLRVISKENLHSFIRSASKENKEDAVVLHYALSDANSVVVHGVYFADELIGFAVLPTGGRHLRSLFVKKDYRSNGVAARVLESLQVTSTIVTKDNPTALEFFERVGFVVANDLPFAWQLQRKPAVV